MNYKEINWAWVIFTATILHTILGPAIGYGASVQGVIHYNGTQTGTILVAALTERDLSIVASITSLSAPGSYNLTCPPGSYYIVAQLDLDGSGSLSFDNPLEPFGDYDGPGPDGKLIVEEGTVEGIDIYLPEIKQGCVLKEYAADYFSYPPGGPGDMAYYNGYLWICDFTWEDQGPDLYKITPANGDLVESIDLGIPNVCSIEWIGNALWACYNDITSWKLKKFSYDGTFFTPDVTIQLPSSTDWNVVWSLNIAWDGSLMWVQEKGENGSIYKVNLTRGSIEETITSDVFGSRGSRGTGDISDICFSNGFLWGMDDDNPIIVQINPSTFEQRLTFFAVDQQYLGEGGKYTGMVKVNEKVYFFQRNSQGPYKIYIGRIRTDLAAFAANFGRIDCNQAGGCAGDVDGDGDVDGSDLADLAGILSCCQEQRKLNIKAS